MSQTSPINAVAEWVSPFTGVLVDFYRGHNFHVYRNPSTYSMSRLANLIKSNPNAFKVTPWTSSGIVGWQANVQQELSESVLTDSEKGCIMEAT